jgi:hypothetical protein
MQHLRDHIVDISSPIDETMATLQTFIGPVSDTLFLSMYVGINDVLSSSHNKMIKVSVGKCVIYHANKSTNTLISSSELLFNQQQNNGTKSSVLLGYSTMHQNDAQLSVIECVHVSTGALL